MPAWRNFPLPDGSYADDTRPWAQQDVVNYLPTFAEAQNTRSTVLYRTAPGLRAFAYVGDGPHRGAHNCEGRRFIVSGKKLYQVATDGNATELGTIPGTGRVSMAHNQIANGNQVIIGTIDNAYVWNTVTETLTAAGVPLQSVDFINQRFVGVDQQRRFWRHSALVDGITWSDLDVFSSESSPDRIVGLKVLGGEVYVFNERTIEVFTDAPTETQVFQRTVVIQRGCISGDTICRVGGQLFFVGDDYMPYRLDGYTPVPIGTKAIVGELSTHEPRRLFGMVWEDRGYLVYYVTATDGMTWGHDLTTGKWHRRQSYGRNRWAINTLCKFDTDWYAGSAYNGGLYRLEWGFVYEGCEIMPRILRTGVLHNAGNRVRVHALRITAATGEDALIPDCEPPKITFFNSAGEGGSYGAFRIFYAEAEGFPSANVLDADVSAAFAGASSVVLTGIALDPSAADAELGAPVPNVDFTTVNREMSDEVGQSNRTWLSLALEGESHSWFWVRVSVDGVLYYGALHVEGGV